jgi:lipoprotein-releasing system permease protein
MAGEPGPGPFSAFEWMVAGRYLRARGREGIISVIAGFSLVGIMLGVATLIIVLAVMNGFRTELLDKILGVNGHLTVQALGGPFPDYQRAAADIRAVPGVTGVVPFVEGQVMVSTANQSNGALVRGLSEDSLARLDKISGNIRFGSLVGFNDSQSILIGARLANNLGLTVGDSLTLVAPRGAVTPFGTAPRIKSYPVAAIFEVGMSEYDTSLIFLPLAEAQAYFNKPGTVTAIEVFLDDPDRAGELRDGVEEAAGGPVYLTEWSERNRTFFTALQVERDLMFIIVSLIVLVAALNIVSGMIMLVKDKRGDIAILRTMGATRGAIMRVFFITGASIGVTGTALGFIVGTVFCANIEWIRGIVSRITGTRLFAPELYYLTRLPAEMRADEVAAVIAMALALSFLATIYPSWRAAKLDPVKALRYE